MNKTKVFLLLFASALITVSCNKDDEDVTHGDNSGNTHAEEIYTEKGFENQAKSSIYGLEIPRLTGNKSDIYVAHYTTAYGLNYAMEYDCVKRAAKWIAFKWYDSNSVNNWNRNNWRNGETFNGYGGVGDEPFQPDPVIPYEYQVQLDEHRSNGYDRGHMLASQDRVNSKEANGQTFYLSNMHPQIGPNFNQSPGIWNNLEGVLRQMNKSSMRDTMYVVKGGTIADGQILKYERGLVVPKYFFMAVLSYRASDSKVMGGYKAIAFWMEHKGNTDSKFSQYAISIDELEEKTGIDFFCNLPDKIESEVESKCVPSAWGGLIK